MKKKIKVEISWFIPWFTGYFFTLGYTGIVSSMNTWYEQFLVALISFIFWPLFLGGAISGRINF